jgi:hypothetical protein
MINVWDYNDEDRLVEIVCLDGQILRGYINSIDDEEDSGLGEEGLSITTNEGLFVGIGQSEIFTIQIPSNLQA